MSKTMMDEVRATRVLPQRQQVPEGLESLEEIFWELEQVKAQDAGELAAVRSELATGPIPVVSPAAQVGPRVRQLPTVQEPVRRRGFWARVRAPFTALRARAASVVAGISETVIPDDLVQDPGNRVSAFWIRVFSARPRLRVVAGVLILATSVGLLLVVAGIAGGGR